MGGSQAEGARLSDGVGRSVGHVEDVVVHDSTRGKGFGRLLLLHLSALARAMGCYKVILNCAEKNRGFYEKCGFVYREVSMARYL